MRSHKEQIEQMEDVVSDQKNIGKLVTVIDEAVAKAAASVNLPSREILKILECTNVEMMKDIETVLQGDKRLHNGLDAAQLSGAIEQTLVSISAATDLDTDEITTIFSTKPGASVEDVACRLYEQSRADRGSYA